MSLYKGSIFPLQDRVSPKTAQSPQEDRKTVAISARVPEPPSNLRLNTASANTISSIALANLEAI
jgi:hypothetical protein